MIPRLQQCWEQGTTSARKDYILVAVIYSLNLVHTLQIAIEAKLCFLWHGNGNSTQTQEQEP